MRRFLTVLICLSTLAFAQNVVAGTPVAAVESGELLRVLADQPVGGQSALESAGSVGGEMPSPGTLMLLVTGLAGLAAAGGRPREEREARATA